MRTFNKNRFSVVPSAGVPCISPLHRGRLRCSRVNFPTTVPADILMSKECRIKLPYYTRWFMGSSAVNTTSTNSN